MMYQIKHKTTNKVLFEEDILADRLTTLGQRKGIITLLAYKNKVDLSEANLSRADLSGADLYGANLSRADLYGANLYGANLSRADLSGAHLSRANLYGANLYGANLYEANLSRADLSGANLYGVNLSGADLSRANLSEADLSRANLYGADLSGADLYGANLSNTCLIYCGERSDRYHFYAMKKDGEVWIIAGCRFFEANEAIKHWEKTRGGTVLGLESLQFVEKAMRLIGEKKKKMTQDDKWGPWTNHDGKGCPVVNQYVQTIDGSGCLVEHLAKNLSVGCKGYDRNPTPKYGDKI